MKRGAMSKPIDPDIREQLAEDVWMRSCIIDHIHEGRIEFQHAMTYAGKRIGDIWSILPMCQKAHREQAKYRTEQKQSMLHRIHHFHALREAMIRYPKSDLFR